MRPAPLAKARPGLSPRLRSGRPLGAQAGRGGAFCQAWEQRWPAGGRKGRAGTPLGPQQAPSLATGIRQVPALGYSCSSSALFGTLDMSSPVTILAADSVSEAAQQRSQQFGCWQGAQDSSVGISPVRPVELVHWAWGRLWLVQMAQWRACERRVALPSPSGP